MPSKPSESPKTTITEQFRKSAEALAVNMSLVLLAQELRDEAAILVGKHEGSLLAARAELTVREEALKRTREITAPQSEFFLNTMEEEAHANIAYLRPAGGREAEQAGA